MAEALICFVCGAEKHRKPDRAAPSTETPLTIYEGKWSYCPRGAIADHRWTAITPAALDHLKLRIAGRMR
jgi:hypothetical protein